MVGLAGWLFADLLLALAVIFIGMSMIPRRTQEPPTRVVLDCRPFYHVFGEEEVSDTVGFGRGLSRLITDSLQRRDLTDPRPAVVLLFGGYNRSETVGHGQGRALRKVPVLRGAYNGFRSVPIRSYGSRRMDTVPIGDAGRYGLLIYFVFKGSRDVTGCSDAVG